jgi:DNA topoisomerase-1
MKTLQHLYEKGAITYMRTDNPNLSEGARQECLSMVKERFGAKSCHERVYRAQNAHSQDAHEAIRPTHLDVDSLSSGFPPQEQEVYHMIWKRTLASQMTPHVLEKQTLSIHCDADVFLHTSQQDVCLGWKRIHGSGDSGKVFPLPMSLPYEVSFCQGMLRQEYKDGKKRYTAASLIQTLESKGIGRPSTFSTFGTKLLQRAYVALQDSQGHEVQRSTYLIDHRYTLRHDVDRVMLGAETNRYVVTELGQRVAQYLLDSFSDMMEYGFTSSMEEDLERITKDQSLYSMVVEKYITSINLQCARAKK